MKNQIPCPDCGSSMENYGEISFGFAGEVVLAYIYICSKNREHLVFFRDEKMADKGTVLTQAIAILKGDVDNERV